MSEQDGAQSLPKQRRSRKTNTTNQQNGKQTPAVQCPTNDDTEAWKAYWKAQRQLWRTEPEIDAERQKYLAERRSIIPNIKESVYPFKDIKLSRADVEWLLATLESGRGPVNWKDESQREREGLDLRGADLRWMDLSRLPLARMNGGNDFGNFSPEGRKTDAIHLEGAHLEIAHLEGALLIGAHLEGASLEEAHLEGASLTYTHLENANLKQAHFEEARLLHTHLEGAKLQDAFFDRGTVIDEIFLGNKQSGVAFLADLHWGDVNVAKIDWSAITVLGDELTTRPIRGHILSTIWNFFQSVDKLTAAVRAYRQLSVVLRNQGLNEDGARFAYRAQLMRRKVLWYQVNQRFRFAFIFMSLDLQFSERFIFYLQGMSKLVQYLFSLFLDLLAGYGYKPWRSFLAYLLVITAFATTYFVIGHTVGPVQSPLGSVVFSMTSFHGRGFFPGGIGLDDPLTVVAALEAFVGLLIEVTFIATLTQRLFGK